MGDSSFVIVREHIVSIFQLSLRCPKRKKPFCQNTLKTPKNLRSRETLKMKKKSQKKRSERLAINRQRTSTARKSEKIESDKVAASNDLKVCALFFKFLSKKFVF